MTVDVYKKNGYVDRNDYLGNLARQYDLEYGQVTAVADMLGANEDFDGLIVSLDDWSNSL